MPLVTLSLLISIFLSVPGSGSGSAKLRALPVVLTGSGTFAFIYKKAAAETPPPLLLFRALVRNMMRSYCYSAAPRKQ